MATRQRQQKRQPRRQRLLRITVSLSLIMVMRGASDLSEDYVVHLKLFNDDRTKNIANFLKTRSYAFKDVRVSANTLNSRATLISSWPSWTSWQSHGHARRAEGGHELPRPAGRHQKMQQGPGIGIDAHTARAEVHAHVPYRERVGRGGGTLVNFLLVLRT